jgi:hypothetical protein
VEPPLLEMVLMLMATVPTVLLPGVMMAQMVETPLMVMMAQMFFQVPLVMFAERASPRIHELDRPSDITPRPVPRGGPTVL